MDQNANAKSKCKLKRRKERLKLTSKYYRSIIRKELKARQRSDVDTVYHTDKIISSDIFFTSTSTETLNFVTPSTATSPSKACQSVTPSTATSPKTCKSVGTSITVSQSFEISNSIHSYTPVFLPKHQDLQQNLKHWAVEHNVTHNVFNNLLGILKKVNCVDDLTSLPSDCRTLLKTDRTNEVFNTGSGHYYHFGLSIGLTYALENQIFPHNQVIHFDINIDGLPLAKSSGSQFWPILGSLCLGGEPFIIGVWHGFQKPNRCNEVLEPFIKEYLNLKEDGFFYKNQRKQISLSKIICDAPAKSFILSIKAHNAYFGCTKCITEGSYVNRRVCYPELNSALRTNNDFRAGKYGKDYHNNITPLLKLEIDLVKSFPLDYMHLVCLGVMKRLLQFWVRGNMAIRMNADDIDNLNEMILDVRNHISYHDFSRLPRPLHDLDRWKATEFRQFLLYTGPILLRDRLKPSQFMHFLSLVCAIRILCNTTLCLRYNNYARELLVYFVRNFSRIYGQEYITHNVHNLIHLADDVINFGPLEKFSAYKYENCMFQIKKCLKSCNKPLEQFINRVNEKRSCQRKTNVADSKSNIVLNHITSYKEPLLNDNLVKAYKWVHFLHFKLGTDSKNNHCFIRGNIVVKINKIVQCQETHNIFLIYQRYLVLENSFVQPCHSNLFYGGIVENLSDLKEIVALDEVVTKCVHYNKHVVSFLV